MFEIPQRERVLYYGPHLVNVESEPVYREEYELLPDLRRYMVRVMERHNGIGLAAPQVGIFKQYLIIRTDEGKIIDMVNPDILQMFGHERERFEASLSLPPVGNGCKVPRCEQLRVTAGSSKEPDRRETTHLRGMDAVVAQHEIDHLTGTFFIDRIMPNRRREVLAAFHNWQSQQEEFTRCRRQFPITHHS